MNTHYTISLSIK